MLKNVILHSKNNLWTASIIKDEVSKSKILNSTKNIDGQFLKIHLDKFGSSLSKVENEENYHYILKPVCIPGILRNEFYAPKNGRKEITEDKKLFAISSTTLLNNIFRKRSFFSEQIDPIIRLMQGRDTIVLLPTGSGKSLI